MPNTGQQQMQTPRQEPNLIIFTPSPGQNTAPQHIPERHISEPKKQRSPRSRRGRNEWQLNQGQFKQNRSQEISHILPQEPVVQEAPQATSLFIGEEEPSISYLQLPTRNRPQQMHKEGRLCTRCGEMRHTKCYCKASVWCKFCVTGTHSMKACRRYANFVRQSDSV